MSTDTELPSVEALAARIYLATAASRHLVCYESLPDESKQAYRRLVREAQAAELDRLARDDDRQLADWVEREQRTVPGSQAATDMARRITGMQQSRDRLRRRADELRLIGGER